MKDSELLNCMDASEFTLNLLSKLEINNFVDDVISETLKVPRGLNALGDFAQWNS